MLFPTGEFLFAYLPLTLALFFLLARFAGRTAAASWLVIASLVFYGAWRPVHVWLLLASIVFNYMAGGWLLSCQESGDIKTAKKVLIGVVGTNLAVLAYFKYSNFLIGTFSTLTGTELPHADVVLPLGISFFTFTQIAYLVDVYAGKVVERNPVRYALFVTYFPHLVAGPVLHHAQMMPQFKHPEIYSPRVKAFSIGLSFLAIGLFKKVIIADSCAPIANSVFDLAGNGAVGFENAWRGVLAYTLQIYFDFSGYSDMAIGLAMLIGVRLPYNFDSPYRSLNVIDFWRRWHITLSTFLRDYLYIPLGGNKKGTARRYVNLMATMLLGGLWHGASWTFVVWGGLHGLYLVSNHGWRWLCERMNWTLRGTSELVVGGAKFLSSALTLLAVIIAWVFFRADSFHSAANLLRDMAGMTDTLSASALALGDSGELKWIAALLVIARFCPNSQQIIDGYLTVLASTLDAQRRRLIAGWLVGVLAIVATGLVLICESRQSTEFIYFNF
jgi:alginate O-acetyltransferase complex protein AlgI